MQPESYPLEALSDPAPKMVLVAEEDGEVRATLVNQLEGDGYRVVALSDGLELCDYLERVEFSRGRIPIPDLVVSDAKLAGYGGLEICKWATAQKGSFPFILLLPHDDADSWEEAELSGQC